MQLFLDCDGVLADFDKRAKEILGMPSREYEKEKGAKNFWKTIYSTPDFFFTIDKMSDADELVNATRHLNPIILTGIPRGDWASDQKLRWRDKHFPDLPMICVESKNKFMHMHQDKHNIIIDDWPKYKPIWEENGGTFILHTSAENSLNELRSMEII